jgi:hypothetical protein
MFKSAATLTLSLTLLLTSGWAQQNPRPPKPPKEPKAAPEQKIRPPLNQNPEATIERVRKILRLTGQQVFHVRSLVLERNRQLVEVHENDGNAQSRKAENDAIQQHFLSELRPILTLEQADRLDNEVFVRPGAFR